MYSSIIHPDVSTAVSPVGSIVALRHVFHLCLLLPLVNNHKRLLFMRPAIYDTVILNIWPYALWYSGLYSTLLSDLAEDEDGICKIALRVRLKKK